MRSVENDGINFFSFGELCRGFQRDSIVILDVIGAHEAIKVKKAGSVWGARSE